MLGIDLVAGAALHLLVRDTACPAARPVAVRVMLVERPAVEEEGQSARILSAAPARRGEHTLPGMTLGRFEGGVSVELETRHAWVPDPRRSTACLMLEGVTLRLVEAGRIRIAREARASPRCRREVRAHERRHAAIAAEGLKAAMPRIEESLRRALADPALRQPVPLERTEAFWTWTQGALMEIGGEGVAAAEQASLPAQQALDSPAEYRRISAFCQGVLDRILN